MKRSLIIVAFIALLTACQQGDSRPEYVGRVNGADVSYKQYISAVRRSFESYQLRHNDVPLPYERKRLVEEAWNNIVQSLVLSDLYYRYGVRVTQDEVLDSLLTNPPRIVLESKLLQIDGEFSQALYENALQTGEPVNLDWLKERYFSAVIPSRKLRQAVLNDMDVSDEKLRREYDIRYSHAVVDLIAITESSIPEPRVTQPEITAWYDAHRDSFAVAPRCDLQWVVFQVVPSRNDSLATKAKVDSLVARLDAGERFATLAKQYSDDPSSVLGGDIGYVSIETLPPYIAKQMAQNEWQIHTRPFQANGKWYIYRPLKKTRNLVKLQQIVITPKASRETLTEVLNELHLFTELVGDIGMDHAAQEFGLKRHEKRGATPDDVDLGVLGASPGVVSDALQAADGKIFEPMFHDPLNSYVLIQVIHSEEGGVKPLYEVTDEIAERLQRQRRTQMARAEAARLAGLSNPVYEARQKGYPVETILDFGYSTPVSGERRTALNREILQQKQGKWAVASYSDDYAWLTSVSRSTPADPAGYQAVRGSLRATLLDEMRPGYFENWLKQQIENADVRDWRPTLPMFE